MSTAQPTLEYRYASRTDLPAVDAFNTVGLTTWEHEFFSPSKPRSYLALSLDGPRIVGSEGYIDYELVLDGNVRLTHRSERTLVSPDHRGQGIFPKLIQTCTNRALADGSQFCWGATAAVKAFQKAGFVAHTGFRTYAVLPLFPARYFVNFFMRNRSVPLNPAKLVRLLRTRDLSTLKEMLSLAASATVPMRVHSLFRRPRKGLVTTSTPLTRDDVDALHARIRQSRPFVHLRHTDALYDWLEAEGRNRFVHVYTYERSALRSYLTVDVGTSDSFATVIDFCSESEEFLRTSLNALKGPLSATGHATLIFAVNTANSEQRHFLAQLTSAGAMTAGTGGSFVVQPLGLAASPLYDSMRGWYLTDLWLTLGSFAA